MCLSPAYAVLFRSEHRTRHLCPIVHRIVCISISRPQLRSWNNTCHPGAYFGRIQGTAWSVRSSCRNSLQKHFQLCTLSRSICPLLHAVRRSSCRNCPRPNSLSRTLSRSICPLLLAVRRSSCRNGPPPNSPFRTLSRPRQASVSRSVPV